MPPHSTLGLTHATRGEDATSRRVVIKGLPIPIPKTQTDNRRKVTLVIALESPQLSSPNRHFIYAGHSDPHHDDEESCASYGPSTRHQSCLTVAIEKKGFWCCPSITQNKELRLKSQRTLYNHRTMGLHRGDPDHLLMVAAKRCALLVVANRCGPFQHSLALETVQQHIASVEEAESA